MQPIGELDSLDTKSGGFQIPFPEAVKKDLIEGMNIDLDPALFIASNEVVGILESARNIVLEWALELEKNGILGEGMSFSKDEKNTASHVNYQITNNIGSMSNSQLQQASNSSTQAINISENLDQLCLALEEIRSQLAEKEFNSASLTSVSTEVDKILAERLSGNPKDGAIREAMLSIRKILESAAGNLLAKGALYELGRFF